MSEAQTTTRRVSRHALNNPVNAPLPETLSTDLPGAELPPVQLGEGELPDREPESVIAVSGQISDDYARALAFNEEPVTIIIQPGSEKNSPKWIECHCQGVPAEVQTPDGKWVKFGWLPVNVPVITKRKYAEIILRSKPIDVQTQHDDTNVQYPVNTVLRNVRALHPVSVMLDKNPMGPEWLRRVMADL